jgi:hypothetical protein
MLPNGLFRPQETPTPPLTKSKSSNFNDAIRTGLDVPWFQITMRSPLFMGGFERLGNLPGDAQGFAYHDRANPFGTLYRDTRYE